MSVGFYSSALGWVNQSTNAPNGVFTITDDLDMQGYNINNADNAAFAGTILAGTRVTTPLVDRPNAGALNLGTSTATVVNISRAGGDVNINSDSTTLSGSLQAPSLATNIIDTINLAGTLSIGGTKADTINISKAGADINIKSDTTTFEPTGKLYVNDIDTVTVGESLLIGNTRADTIDLNAGLVYVGFGDMEFAPNGKIKVNEIQSVSGGGSVSIEGIDLKAVGTTVKLCVGDYQGTPPTTTSTLEVESRGDARFIVAGDLDQNEIGNSSLQLSNTENKQDLLITAENAGTVKIISSHDNANPSISDSLSFIAGATHAPTAHDQIIAPAGGYEMKLSGSTVVNPQIPGSLTIPANLVFSSNKNINITGNLGGLMHSSDSTGMLIGNQSRSDSGIICIADNSLNAINAGNSGGSVIVGNGIGKTSTGITNSVVVGYGACAEKVPNYTTVVGASAGSNSASFTGQNNTIVGGLAGTSLTTGGGNTFIGALSGVGVTGAANVTLIGYNASGAAASSNCIGIGSNVSGTGGGAVLIGPSAVGNNHAGSIAIGRAVTVTAANSLYIGSATYPIALSATANTGAAGAPPAQVANYLPITMNGTAYKIPLYLP